MTVPGTSDPGPLSQVRQGMRVVDSRGDEVGLVETVRMGDREAVTDSGESTRDVGLLDDRPERGLSEQAQHHLARTGYVRIDRSGVFTGRVTQQGTRSPAWRVTPSTSRRTGTRSSAADARRV